MKKRRPSSALLLLELIFVSPILCLVFTIIIYFIYR